MSVSEAQALIDQINNARNTLEAEISELEEAKTAAVNQLKQKRGELAQLPKMGSRKPRADKGTKRGPRDAAADDEAAE